MISNRPYLLRAFYDWIVDSKCTPILVIDTNNPRCQIPAEFVDGGEIVFNVSPVAVRDFQISNQNIEFLASFSGISHFISAPVGAILAIYAEEYTEDGLFLDAEDELLNDNGNKVQLRGIDGTSAESLDGYAEGAPVISSVSRPKPVLKLVE